MTGQAETRQPEIAQIDLLADSRQSNLNNFGEIDTETDLSADLPQEEAIAPKQRKALYQYQWCGAKRYDTIDTLSAEATEIPDSASPLT